MLCRKPENEPRDLGVLLVDGEMAGNEQMNVSRPFKDGSRDCSQIVSPGAGRDTSHNHITDLAIGMAGGDLD
jgi:hypothetical protein